MLAERSAVTWGIRAVTGRARRSLLRQPISNKTTSYRRSTESLRLIEHFMPIAPDTVEWTVTVDDPKTWTRPWTFAMNLTKKDDSQRPFEYACHEGHYGLYNILS